MIPLKFCRVAIRHRHIYFFHKHLRSYIFNKCIRVIYRNVVIMFDISWVRIPQERNAVWVGILLKSKVGYLLDSLCIYKLVKVCQLGLFPCDVSLQICKKKFSSISYFLVMCLYRRVKVCRFGFLFPCDDLWRFFRIQSGEICRSLLASQCHPSLTQKVTHFSA
jgi:hypothetical protein